MCWLRAPIIEGARDTPAQAQVALGTAQGDQGHAAHARRAAHEARRGAFPGKPCMASCCGRSEKEASFTCKLNRDKLRKARRREDRYLLRTNLTEQDPAKLWSYYLQLVAVEEAFKNLKGDLALRPIHHQKEGRIEAHIFIAFLAYCLHATLRCRLHALAPGLTPRSVFDKFAAVQMIDVHIPITDGRELVLERYTEPERDLKLLLEKLKLALPQQPPPKITGSTPSRRPPRSADLCNSPLEISRT